MLIFIFLSSFVFQKYYHSFVIAQWTTQSDFDHNYRFAYYALYSILLTLLYLHFEHLLISYWIWGTFLLSLVDIHYLVVEPLILRSMGLILFFISGHCYFPSLINWLVTPLIVYSFFYILWFFLPESMGMGDIKLLILWAFQISLMTLIYLIAIASTLALIYLLINRWIAPEKIKRLPFVPFLTLALTIVIQ